MYIVKYRRADLRPVLITRTYIGRFSIEFFDKNGCTPTIHKRSNIGYAVHNELPYKEKNRGYIAVVRSPMVAIYHCR